MSHSTRDVRTRLLEQFPERQIYHRTGGEVHYFVLSTRLQILIVSLITLISAWCIFTVTVVLMGQMPFANSTRANARMAADYERRIEDQMARYQDAKLIIQQQREAFDTQTREFAEAHDTITQFVSSTPVMGNAEKAVVKYASSKILMAPALRDVSPRQARKQIQKHAELHPNIEAVIDPRVKKLKSTQSSILADAEIDTLNRIEANRAILRATNLNIEDILKNGPLGEGGLFVDLGDQANEINENGFGPRTVAIKARVAEAEALDMAVNALPLGVPVSSDHYRTSGYGLRKDPFNKRPAFHTGVDFGAYRLAPIVATADGTVIKAGRNGSYGKTVEIDHGYGFKTRYAHLEKTFVKRGAKVKKGQKIAGMGSTGRSTATHLHYEVFFQGHDYDPEKFLKAGNYVQ
ncbi:MAG: peptidoglycan DD-metalloendopeptidase family protein [Maricaulaceae bacterium]